ncbi:restriction endonuclease subunit S [Aeromonas veronii]|uniref:restriction endonuclease subunit S n=1 Tax=Aeromonas veronii TaxID=654 RepID=UPI000390D25E|nr:restriction endonuclease subunit S [Aeromonas veronii]QMS74749.1 restriction endonuclease subunit S [Aeromonas veronii Hm21]
MSQAVATQQKELAGKYHPYPKYKDSGVEWLGDIPNEWLTIPVGRLFSRIKRTGHSEKELLSVYRDYGVIPKSSRDDNNNKESDDLAPYQLVRPNDLVMNKMKAWQGSIAVSEYEGIVSPAYFVYEPSNKLFELAHPRYVHYLLRNPIYITQYMSRSKGIRVNQWDLDPDEFKLIELLLPSKQEQSKIFEFLDYETAQIDRLIAQQQRLIELLKEKRQAVISHAVTKGLNPDAPMKNSGVEWLGQVPEHWEVAKLRRFILEHRQGYYTTDPYVDEGIKLLRITDLRELGHIDVSSCPLVPNIPSVMNFKLKEGDVVFARTGGAGSFGIIDELECDIVYASYLIRFRFNSKHLTPSYLRFLLLSDSLQLSLKQNIHGGVNQNIHAEDIKDAIICVPPINEQLAIEKALTAKMKRYSELLEESEKSVRLMSERRTALISAAVTGKIDLRGWTPPVEEAAA